MYTFENTCQIQIAAQAGGGELTQVDPRIVEGVGQAMKVQTGGLGGAFVWPSLLRKLDRIDPSYKTARPPRLPGRLQRPGEAGSAAAPKGLVQYPGRGVAIFVGFFRVLQYSRSLSSARYMRIPLVGRQHADRGGLAPARDRDRFRVQGLARGVTAQ